jgi:citrate lyase beta subunit
MSAVDLGATLYVPATLDAANSTAYGFYPDLRSMVICLEDSVAERDIGAAKAKFCNLLKSFETKAPHVQVYARPRNIGMLVWMLKQEGISHVEGFVLPKVTTQSLSHWLAALMQGTHQFMPTIETEEAFDRHALERIRDQLLPYASRVKAVRIGGNDILNVLGVRRSRFRTAYDGPLAAVIRDIAHTFIPRGFAVSAPVFEHYASLELLQEEVERDIEHGLLTKTAIHPVQLATIHACYRPSVDEVTEAQQILAHDGNAVFGVNGSMCEPATHIRWAGNIIQRAQVYGYNPEIHSLESQVA